jgi:hypothetical protein
MFSIIETIYVKFISLEIIVVSFILEGQIFFCSFTFWQFHYLYTLYVVLFLWYMLIGTQRNRRGITVNIKYKTLWNE